MPTPSKRFKKSHTTLNKQLGDFLGQVSNDRRKVSDSIMEFNFNKKRVRLLSSAKDIPENAKGVLYWMTREQRVQDNWSLLYSQKLAMKTELPLHVCFCLRRKFMDATIRHYKFMLKGLEEVASELKLLDIPFHLIVSQDGVDDIIDFVKTNKIGAVVIDFSPLKIAKDWALKIKESLPSDIPLCQVDGHNIVPCWIASDKLEYSARTIRNKINDKLSIFLTEFPPVVKHPFHGKFKSEPINWKSAESTLEVNMDVEEISWAKPGYKAGMDMLFQFCQNRLQYFASKRNDPLGEALSNLSPWFHFGQISVQRCILFVQTFKQKYKSSVDAFCEEAIIRRELADNFCFYNPNYDNLTGANDWAKKTLDDHRKDKREYVYSCKEFEESKTHDDLWNAAQIQLVKEGKMHGFLRMYWAKKILEWTENPEEALRIALLLNDRYSIDGRDPNGFVGCMWSICGIHDQGWKERDIFGKIRYMNYKGCERKFDVKSFVAKYGCKIDSKSKK